MMAMTDERVRSESEPFDHPELVIPAGDGPMISIQARNAAGAAASSLTVTIAPFTTPTNHTSILISGIKDSGTTVQLSVNGGPALPPDTATDTTWGKQLSGLAGGSSTIVVTATEPTGAMATASADILVVLPDGNIKGTGTVDISDALKALRISTGLVVPTQLELLRGDVAPLVGGVPSPDGSIALADALLILRKVVGLVTF
jgi:hypothetical protein